MKAELIEKYFPQLTEIQRRQVEMLQGLYEDWNAKINVISRKDIDNLYEHHVLHSMAIAKVVHFKPGTRILDFGCGGGFPGIPLAILFPECDFTLIDGTGKKILVATEVAKALELKNVHAIHRRGEEEKGVYDFIVSRAVMPMPDLLKIVAPPSHPKGRGCLIDPVCRNAYANGIFCLKGGNLDEELRPFRKIVEKTEISTFFSEEWFKEKFVIYIPI